MRGFDGENQLAEDAPERTTAKAPALNLFDATGKQLSGEKLWGPFRLEFERALPQATRDLGRAARRELELRMTAAALWAQSHHDPSRGAPEPFVAVLLRRAQGEFHAEYPRRQLRDELRDEEARVASARDERACTVYLGHWRVRLTRLVRAHPGRWKVADIDEVELVSRLELELLDGVRRLAADPDAFLNYEATGLEASFRLASRAKDRMRTQRRMFLVRPGAEGAEIAAPSPSAEEMLLARERPAQMISQLERLRAGMSKRQKEWFLLFQGLIEQGGHLNLAEAAARLGKNRSSAMRARDEMCRVLRRNGFEKLIYE